MQTESGPIGRLTRGREVHIVGAGISGLLMAYYLKKAGHKVTVFEKERVGGKIQTKITEAGPAEKAANAIYTSPEAMELIAELGLSPLSPAPDLKKKIWRGQKALSFPLRFWEIARLLIGLFKRPPHKKDMTVLDFFSPLLGKKTAYEVLSAALGGIYAAPADALDFQSIFKESPNKKSYFQFFAALAKNKKKASHRATSMSFKGGMEEFIEALKTKLEADIVYRQIVEIDSDVNTIICCEADEAAKIVEKSLPKVAEALKEIDYMSLSTGTYFFKKPIPQLERTFGVLLPPKSGFKAIGILHNNAIFESRTSFDDLESYTFISRSPDYSQSDALSDACALSKDPFQEMDIFTREQTCWTRGIPLYNSKRRKAIDKIRTLLKDSEGVALFGNYVDGISIREMIKAAKEFAARTD